MVRKGQLILSVAKRNYSVIHKEALAISWSVKNSNKNLLGQKFILDSDHSTLLYGENKGIIANRYRIGDFLLQYYYELQYIKGKQN